MRSINMCSGSVSSRSTGDPTLASPHPTNRGQMSGGPWDCSLHARGEGNFSARRRRKRKAQGAGWGRLAYLLTLRRRAELELDSDHRRLFQAGARRIGLGRSHVATSRFGGFPPLRPASVSLRYSASAAVALSSSFQTSNLCRAKRLAENAASSPDELSGQSPGRLSLWWPARSRPCPAFLRFQGPSNAPCEGSPSPSASGQVQVCAPLTS